jgi:hypothetical protein
MVKTSDLIIFGALGLGAYMLLKKNGDSTTTTSTDSTLPIRRIEQEPPAPDIRDPDNPYFILPVPAPPTTVIPLNPYQRDDPSLQSPYPIV